MMNRMSRFLEEVNGSTPPAFILGASANGLAFIRSLGVKGIPVVGLDSIPSPGTYSKYCKKVILSDIVENEHTWLEFLTAAGRRLPCKAAIIPTGDAHVLFLSRNRNDLSRYFSFSLPEEWVLESIANKKTQYELAKKYGLTIPTTYFPQNVREVASLTDLLSYPCLLKPYYSHLWRKYSESKRGYETAKLVEVNSPEELVETYRRMVKSEVAIMVQERIPGGDMQLYGLFTYFGSDSEPLAIFTKRKLRQTEMGYGDGCFQESTWEPTVAELGVSLLKNVKYRGLASIEFKRDPRDTEFKLIEVNPRSATGEEMAVRSGVDIPYIAYRDILGEKVQNVPSFCEGVKWVHLEWDLRAALVHRGKRRIRFTEWISSLRGTESYAIWRRSDPLPFLIVCNRMFRAVLRKIFSFTRGRRHG